MLPEFPELSPLGLEDRKKLAPYLARAPQPICDLSFTNLLLWRDCEAPSFTTLHGNLCLLLAPHSEEPYFLEPLGGECPVETVRLCLKRASRLSRVGESLAHSLPTDEFRIEPLLDHFDYLFRVSDLSDLKGKKYDGKRNQIRRFTRSQSDYEFRPLEEGDLGRAQELFERWSGDREHEQTTGPSSIITRECQAKAVRRALEAYSVLGLMGGGIFIAGEMEGFIIGSELNPTTAVAHFQYADAAIPGIYQMLLWQACQNLFGRYELINLEEDLGIPGLRKTKLSYQPVRLEPKYEIRLRSSAQGLIPPGIK